MINFVPPDAINCGDKLLPKLVANAINNLVEQKPGIFKLRFVEWQETAPQKLSDQFSLNTVKDRALRQRIQALNLSGCFVRRKSIDSREQKAVRTNSEVLQGGGRVGSASQRVFVKKFADFLRLATGAIVSTPFSLPPASPACTQRTSERTIQREQVVGTSGYCRWIAME